jgi:hypothetical protein
MVRVHVLRGVIASGQRLVAGTAAEISDGDARILIASSKVVLAPEVPAPLPAPEAHETADAPMRETATRSRRRKATLQ